MDEKNLSARLTAAAAYIPKQARLADIGSDHAYLPTALMLEDQISYAVAGEVVEGPFEAAKKQVNKLKLNDTIQVRLANGLDAILPEDQIDCIAICGMGGTLISEILDKGFQKRQLTGKERLVLQPNVGEQTLRKWLAAHEYTIVDEAIVKEDGKIYELIIAEKQETVPHYTEKELKFGILLSKEKGPIFKEKWQKELEKVEAILASLAQSQSNQEVKQAQMMDEIALIKEML
ncbi:tRNA (adenine(22)-N(1))-methyltransferase [Isobaculum melis]|uniref:tRNA (Adenine22-N1)-methyltransferase n=1 Tax=Isobaculum melis TaxID=142588 RepID=A0A1H9R3N2_9LACT|nr:tRNA (adenine(22)-N(1))-methyltransferase TrmK [Isobaculum melis]SER67451.1 tRNA (adenine22-N1)-methyltransferase [Isobaculum melis]